MQPDDLEPGDIVEVVSTTDRESLGHVGMRGVYDNVWTRDGKTLYVVLFDGEEFAYADQIKFIKKGASNA